MGESCGRTCMAFLICKVIVILLPATRYRRWHTEIIGRLCGDRPSRRLAHSRQDRSGSCRGSEPVASSTADRLHKRQRCGVVDCGKFAALWRRSRTRLEPPAQRRLRTRVAQRGLVFDGLAMAMGRTLPVGSYRDGLEGNDARPFCPSTFQAREYGLRRTMRAGTIHHRLYDPAIYRFPSSDQEAAWKGRFSGHGTMRCNIPTA